LLRPWIEILNPTEFEALVFKSTPPKMINSSPKSRFAPKNEHGFRHLTCANVDISVLFYDMNKIITLATIVLLGTTCTTLSAQTVSTGVSYSTPPVSLTVSGTTWNVGLGVVSNAPPNASSSTSGSVAWYLYVGWLGYSNGAPTATGNAVVGLTKNSGAVAATHASTFAYASGSCDLWLSTAYSVGAIPPVIDSQSSHTTTTIPGSSLTFVSVGVNAWQATYNFASNSLSASCWANADLGTKGAASSASVSVVTDSNYGLNSSSYVITPHP